MTAQRDGSTFCHYLKDYCRCTGIWCHVTTGDVIERAEVPQLVSGEETR